MEKGFWTNSILHNPSNKEQSSSHEEKGEKVQYYHRSLHFNQFTSLLSKWLKFDIELNFDNLILSPLNLLVRNRVIKSDH